MELANIIVRPNQLPREMQADLQELEEILNTLGKAIEDLHEYDAHREMWAERLKTRVDRYKGLYAKIEAGLRFKPSEGSIALSESELWDRFDQVFEQLDRLIEDVYEGN